MKISELIYNLEKKKEDLGDVQVKCVCPMSEGFRKVKDVLDRRDYHDYTFFGNPIEKGKFVVIELR